MSDEHKVHQATSAKSLRERIMDSRIPKNEAEWWTNRHIQQLERENAALRKDVAEMKEIDESEAAIAADTIKTLKAENAALREQIKNEHEKAMDGAKMWLNAQYAELQEDKERIDFIEKMGKICKNVNMDYPWKEWNVQTYSLDKSFRETVDWLIEHPE
jgi:capsule polysaccharide export protein KpsE/RkpR